MIKLKNIFKKYLSERGKVDVLSNFNYHLKSGQALLIRGTSGSGKTTLLNLIGCLCRPTAGEIYIDGEEVSHLPEHFLANLRKKKIGFVFQQFNLLAGLSVVDNITLPLMATDISMQERIKQGKKLLKKVGMEKLYKENVSKLSGGEQQRVALLRAVVNNPSLILADEPTSNVDRKNAEMIIDFLKEMKEAGKTLVIASHDDVFRKSKLVDRILDMNEI